MASTPTPTEIGTLIVVILKARNLPNKRHLGKQAPYCTLQFNGETRRTKVIKRGGQHPEWDEELRFTLFEDEGAPALEDGEPPAPPPKDGRARKVKGGERMLLCCFADDPREPDVIGETKVDLTEVLTKGETDEWFPLSHKDRYAGEVYLELTFWSNAPPPQKKTVPTSAKYSKDYGGSGQFTPIGDDPYASDGGGYELGEGASGGYAGGAYDTIRPSNSSAKIPLYMPAYEPRADSVDQMASDFGELAVGDHARRSSTYPPLHSDYTGYSAAAGTASSMSSQSYGYHEQPSGFDGPPSNYQRAHRLSDSSMQPYAPYQAPYETGASSLSLAPSASFSHQPPVPAPRRPRYSMPVTSSGFVPVASSSEPSGFVQHDMTGMTGIQPPPSRMSMASYAPSLSHTPAPMLSHTPAPMHPHTPAPVRGPRHSLSQMPTSSFAHMNMAAPVPGPPMPSSMTAPSHLSQLQAYTPAPMQPFLGYGPPPPASAPPVQYPPPLPPPSTLPAPPHSAPPQAFQDAGAGHVIPAHVPGARPLPTPAQYPGPPPPLAPSGSFDRIPPPPPLPSSGPSTRGSSPVPPQRAVSGRPSLPLPPPGASPAQMQASAYQSGPPQGPLRRSSSHLALQGLAQGQQAFAHPGPPPRPPAQMLAPPGAAGQYSQGGY